MKYTIASRKKQIFLIEKDKILGDLDDCRTWFEEYSILRNAVVSQTGGRGMKKG